MDAKIKSLVSLILASLGHLILSAVFYVGYIVFVGHLLEKMSGFLILAAALSVLILFYLPSFYFVFKSRKIFMHKRVLTAMAFSLLLGIVIQYIGMTIGANIHGE